METIRRICHYLANLEWVERPQEKCVFCDRRNLASIVYEDDKFIVVDNIRNSGQFHWLIMPRAHVLRDMEALTGHHVALLHAMGAIKRSLVQRLCPDASPSAIHAGYHRGRRRLWGTVFYPDIVSIHHLHLHVIVRPRLVDKIFKYPSWLPLMWKSDAAVMKEVLRKSRKAGI